MTDPQVTAQQELLSRNIRELGRTLETMDPRRTAFRKLAETTLNAVADHGEITGTDQFDALMFAIGDLELRLIKLEDAQAQGD